jgi:hypothetical protein
LLLPAQSRKGYFKRGRRIMAKTGKKLAPPKKLEKKQTLERRIG